MGKAFSPGDGASLAFFRIGNLAGPSSIEGKSENRHKLAPAHLLAGSDRPPRPQPSVPGLAPRSLLGPSQCRLIRILRVAEIEWIGCRRGGAGPLRRRGLKQTALGLHQIFQEVALVQQDPEHPTQDEIPQPEERSHEEAEGGRGIEEPGRPRGARRDRLSGSKDPRHTTSRQARADVHPSEGDKEGCVGPELAVRDGVTF